MIKPIGMKNPFCGRLIKLYEVLESGDEAFRLVSIDSISELYIIDEKIGVDGHAHIELKLKEEDGAQLICGTSHSTNKQAIKELDYLTYRLVEFSK